MTWAFDARRGRKIFACSAFVSSLVLGAAAACSAGNPAPSGDSGDDSAAAGTAGSGAGDAGASGTSPGTSGGAGASGSGTTAGAGGSSGTSGVSFGLTNPGNCGIYTMTLNGVEMQVDPSQGARISSLRLGGADILAGSAVTMTTVNWGSTFWPSPQSLWNWPPIAAIDSAPYACAADDSYSFTLQGAANAGTGPKISVKKKFSGDLTQQAMVIDYTMTNTSTAAIMVAPWEISRVPPGALSFYPAGSAPGTRTGSSFALPSTTTDGSGITWYQNVPSSTQYKLFADGLGGWLATVVGNNVFVKKFDDVPAAAQPPTEAEIEIYSSQYYIEVENQGAYASLAAGASVTWTVRWFVRPLPAGATAAVGDANLLAFVQSLVQ